MDDTPFLTPVGPPTLSQHRVAPSATLAVPAIHDDFDSPDAGQVVSEVLVEILASPLDHDQEPHRGERSRR